MAMEPQPKPLDECQKKLLEDLFIRIYEKILVLGDRICRRHGFVDGNVLDDLLADSVKLLIEKAISGEFKYHSDDETKSFLSEIMQNKIMDRVRKRSSGAGLLPPEIPAPPLPIYINSVDLAKKLREALVFLTEAQRDVWIMRLDGMNYKEIAYAKRRSIVTIRTTFNKSLDTMRSIFGESYQDFLDRFYTE